MDTLRYTSIYSGVVEDVEDPEGLGRCRIRVPNIHGKLSKSEIKLLEWARYVSPFSTGKDKGTFIKPEKGDIVWVMFENGNKNYPVYIGSSFARKEVPTPGPDGDVIYASKLDNGKQAKIVKSSDAFIFSFDETFIKINVDGSVEMSSKNSVSITADKDISINSKGNIDISSEGDVTVNSKSKTTVTSEGDTTVTSKGKTNINSSKDVNISGSKINLNPSIGVYVPAGKLFVGR